MVYQNYAELAAAETEFVDYTRTAVFPTGAQAASIAIHGGGIEPGSGEMAEKVAGPRQGFYEFAGIKPAGNFALHIISTQFDEPQCMALVARSQRVLSWHGYTGTIGVPEVAIGGLDTALADSIGEALTAAGFTVINAPSEISGTNPANICNRGKTRRGVQLEMSRTLRESFFPNGDLSAANRATGLRTATFYAFAQATINALSAALTFSAPSVIVGRGHQLGAGLNVSAVISTRGGRQQITGSSVLTSAEWTRTLDGTSTAVVELPVAGNRCSELGDVEPWSHELALWRDQELVWAGPVTRVEDSRQERRVRIEAADVTAWLDHRICRGYNTEGAPLELTEVARLMISAALAPDDPLVRQYIEQTPTTVTVERKVDPDSTYAMADLKALANLGLNFTTIGRRIVLFGPNRPLVDLPRLTSDNFTGDLELVTTQDLRTSAVVVGDAHTGRFGGITDRYGLLEVLDRADGTLDQVALDKAAKTRVNGRPPLIIDTSQAGSLRRTAPVVLSDLIPGAVGEIAATGNCRSVLLLMRLEQLKVKWTPGGDDVQPTFVPLADYSTL